MFRFIVGLYSVWFLMVLTDFGTMGIRACLFVLMMGVIIMSMVITVRAGIKTRNNG